jgi:hypothetical protein
MKILFKPTLGVFLLFVLLPVAQAQDSTRSLLKPPEHVPTLRIGGIEYVKGEVYLSKTADPEILKQLGFRDVKFFVSASRYHRYTAMWPLKLNLDSLPREIMGFTYSDEDLSPPQQTTVLYGPDGPRIETSSSGSVTVRDQNGSPQQRFAQAIACYPDTFIHDTPFVKGRVYLYNTQDLEKLQKLGFPGFRGTWNARLKETSLDKYLHYWKNENPNDITDKVLEYETCWPIDLDFNKLPKSVVTLISDQLSQEAIQNQRKTKKVSSLEDDESK